MFNGFTQEVIATEDGSVFLRRGGTGPPVLLLHGFPQTHVAWHLVAPALTDRFTVIAADLPGYGQSTLSDRSKEPCSESLTGRFFDPLATWRRWARNVRGRAIPAGHFLMEEAAETVTGEITSFLSAAG